MSHRLKSIDAPIANYGSIWGQKPQALLSGGYIWGYFPDASFYLYIYQ